MKIGHIRSFIGTWPIIGNSTYNGGHAPWLKRRLVVKDTLQLRGILVYGQRSIVKRLFENLAARVLVYRETYRV